MGYDFRRLPKLPRHRPSRRTRRLLSLRAQLGPRLSELSASGESRPRGERDLSEVRGRPALRVRGATDVHDGMNDDVAALLIQAVKHLTDVVEAAVALQRAHLEVDHGLTEGADPHDEGDRGTSESH